MILTIIALIINTTAFFYTGYIGAQWILDHNDWIAGLSLSALSALNGLFALMHLETLGVI